jgi:uncharacterized membrane protein
MNIQNIFMSWDLGTFFSNLTSKAKEWGGYLLVLLGVVLLIAGIVQIVKAFMSHGRGQTNWLMVGGMILVGGFLCATGGGLAAFNNVQKLANVGSGTLDALGK